MKVWITGAGGFMGQHMVNYLLEKNYEVLATYYSPTTDIEKLNPKAKIKECDIRDKRKVFETVEKFSPDLIFHLAAQSFPTKSWENPWNTLETNVLGTVNVFEAVKKFVPDCKIMNACTSGEYGFVNEEEVPVKETHSLKPLHPYAISKLAQEALAYQYFKNFGIKSVSLRIFNTTGPMKKNDVCADFTKRLIEIEKGINSEKKIRVGDLNKKRAITDVRDMIKGFNLALEKGNPGEVYNISGETVYEIKEIINKLRKLVNFEFETWTDDSLLRSTDEPIIYGDSSKLKEKTGWKQEIPLEKTLKDMLEFWRKEL